MVTAASARLWPMLRMVRLVRSFCCAKTCSTRVRIADFLALALAIRFGIGLPVGFRRWIWLRLAATCQERLVNLRSGPWKARGQQISEGNAIAHQVLGRLKAQAMLRLQIEHLELQ